MNTRPIKGRGAPSNPPGRFEEIRLEPDPDWDPAQDPLPSTRLYFDSSQTILSYNDSPDVGFEVSVNPYRGCEHGCVYCYARPTHEYLGFSAGIDFESKIIVKTNAPTLLRRELAAPKWKPQPIAMSGVTDCYQPVERKLRLTRGCLEVLADFRNPVCLVTKNHLVTRDLDILATLAKRNAAAVYLSITTLDPSLTPKLEPRASLPASRLRTLTELRDAGIPAGVLMAPVIPGLTDHEIPALISAAATAGAQFAAFVILRLPHGLGNLFEQWLEIHFPDKKDKVLNRIRAIRGGKLNQSQFGQRMRGDGIFAEQIRGMFSVACRKTRLSGNSPILSTADFRVPGGAQQLGLWPQE